MSRTVNITEEIIVVSEGKKDIGKLAFLGNDGKFDPSVIPMQSVSMSQCGVNMSADLSIPNIAWTNVTWGKKEYDSAQICNSDQTGFTVDADGLYLIEASVCFEINATGVRYIGITKNGSFIANQDLLAAPQLYYSYLPVQYVGRLKKGDVLKAYVYQSSGGALNVLSSPLGGVDQTHPGCAQPRFTLTQLSN
ncbi:hypothetical protein [Pelosinus sp. UFO1]|uniref:hypothetical protein n=1 Tax=Pelosinus sp. UFO1 TaxID=484770 RepID=UPI0004D120A8|nr:hypothetical protein [Pelosinus sp. UFO1]AIF51234.1 hypothetical protein UFO1_1683 [Pelosinus sp. UFO1]